ncbi:macro domain-containing protein [Dankookia sp. P2]|uniref:macro domain-containing protein n=1 Tax=Dankookia sp. P2 TaxID=3423955 RepID=UPI003D6677A8
MTQIIYRTGNLLEAEERHILHGCNARGSMGAGIALAIRQRWPKAFAQYRRQFEEAGLALGTVQVVDCGDKVVLNAITQVDYSARRAGPVLARYDAIRAVMRQVNLLAWLTATVPEAAAVLGRLQRIGMPLLGAGLARGRWSAIAPLIEEEARDFQPVVYLLDGMVPED